MPERRGDHLQITGKGLFGTDMEVRVNGTRFNSIRSLTLYLEADGINTVNIELRPDDIEIDAEALAELVALVDMKRKRDNDVKAD